MPGPVVAREQGTWMEVLIVDEQDDVPVRIRSLRSYDPVSGRWPFASVDQLAALIAADVSPAPAPSTGSMPWTVELNVYEVVAVLRCLDELAAVYAGSALGEVVSRWSGELRRRADGNRAQTGGTASVIAGDADGVGPSRQVPP